MPALRSSKRLKLSKRELAAASSKKMALDDLDVRTLLESRLLGFRQSKFDVDQIHGQIRLHLAFNQINSSIRDRELSKSEITQQAVMTADIAEALEQRLLHMDRNLEALASEKLPKGAESIQEIGWLLQPYLVRIRVALRQATTKLMSERERVGRKGYPGRARLLRIVAEQLSKNSTPAVSVGSATTLAADFLSDCGIAFPTDRRELQKLMAVSKRGKPGKKKP